MVSVLSGNVLTNPSGGGLAAKGRGRSRLKLVFTTDVEALKVDFMIVNSCVTLHRVDK